ncbi:MAG: hypothetical protein QF513_04140 [Gammaproteobacteria bacterium]|jgi:uncharacterized protein YbaR (Trm112 family)|nr:hypothetical protein [Gammaproteobacteria bacterium]MBQ09604.1 hypothetical protein [Gammaproteobacteria bacterium]MDP6146968.1 hypothetical protein [Gammaproteobacteria bacterium]HJL80915.1 hypothetical protein [Gammaproteobacteria bacterium]HJM09476.1 hypothetical protein [Gammaproteobacteria bacterium]|tara:strand:+ start:24892 stop:25134 length:243 start_codon:yes stop_codon:yes gene_type:complete
MDDRLLKILRCPSSGNELIPIDADSIKDVDLNKDLSSKAKTYFNEGQSKAILLNIDSKIAYPIIDNIPMIDIAHMIDMND